MGAMLIAQSAIPGTDQRNASDITLTGRPAAEIAAYFDGFDLVPPGLVMAVARGRC